MKTDIFNLEKIMGFCEKVCYFLMMNLLFLVFCLPVLLFFLFFGIGQVKTALPLFLLCMTSVPPAFSAILYGMNRMVRGEERGVLTDFKKGYFDGFFQKYLLGFGQMVLIFILWTNREFFTKQMPVFPLAVLFTLLFIVVIAISPNLYLLASRYRMRSYEVIKNACVLTITRPGCTLGYVAGLGIVLIAIELCAGTAVLFMASVYGFLISFLGKGMLRVLEEKN